MIPAKAKPTFPSPPLAVEGEAYAYTNFGTTATPQRRKRRTRRPPKATQVGQIPPSLRHRRPMRHDLTGATSSLSQSGGSLGGPSVRAFVSFNSLGLYSTGYFVETQ